MEQIKTLYFLTITISLGLLLIILSSCSKKEYIERTDTLVVTRMETKQDTVWFTKTIIKTDTLRESNITIITQDDNGNEKARETVREIYISKAVNDSTDYYRSLLKELSDSLYKAKESKNQIIKEEKGINSFGWFVIFGSYFFLILVIILLLRKRCAA